MNPAADTPDRRSRAVLITKAPRNVVPSMQATQSGESNSRLDVIPTCRSPTLIVAKESFPDVVMHLYCCSFSSILVFGTLTYNASAAEHLFGQNCLGDSRPAVLRTSVRAWPGPRVACHAYHSDEIIVAMSCLCRTSLKIASASHDLGSHAANKRCG